jgi:hypothetical protein
LIKFLFLGKNIEDQNSPFRLSCDPTLEKSLNGSPLMFLSLAQACIVDDDSSSQIIYSLSRCCHAGGHSFEMSPHHSKSQNSRPSDGSAQPEQNMLISGYYLGRWMKVRPGRATTLLRRTRGWCQSAGPELDSARSTEHICHNWVPLGGVEQQTQRFCVERGHNVGKTTSRCSKDCPITIASCVDRSYHRKRKLKGK